MKHTYKLKIFYPSSNNHHTHQATTKDVEADSYYIDKGGVYEFMTSTGKRTACYPTQYTIIEEIIENG